MPLNQMNKNNVKKDSPKQIKIKIYTSTGTRQSIALNAV
jgi:hypothetical protein